MKIFIDIQNVFYKKGRGTANYTYNIAHALLKRRTFDYRLAFFDKGKERGHRAIVKDLFDIDDSALREYNEVSYGEVGGGSFDKSYADIIGSDADIIHHTVDMLSPYFPGNKTVITAHDVGGMYEYPNVNDYYTAQEACRWSKQLNMVFRPNIGGVFADSEFTASCIREYYPYLSDRIAVTPLAFDSSVFYKNIDAGFLHKSGICSEYFLYVGIMCARKNVYRIIESFEIIAEKNKDICLVLAGDLSKNTLALNFPLKVMQSKYRDRIHYLGRVSNDELRTLYSGARGFLFPSLHEGFGIPILEAQACGCPVITANTTACPEVAGDSAVLVDPYDVEAIADGIERILNNSQLREDLILKGSKNIKRYSWEKTAELTENAYKFAYEMFKS